MYTSHHPCWDAKNRYGLPEECEFDYQVIAGIVEETGEKKETAPKEQEKEVPPKVPEASTSQSAASKAEESFMNIPPDADEEVPFNTGAKDKPTEKEENLDISKSEAFRLPDYIPQKLQDLMYPYLVSEEEVMEAVYQRGYFPRGTPFQNLPGDFIQGVLIGAWPQVMKVIQEMRSHYNIPFND